MVVVDAKLPEQTARALSYLGQRFRNENQQIESVYIPVEGSYFDKHGLLYLELADVEGLAVQLIQAQTFIGTLAQDGQSKKSTIDHRNIIGMVTGAIIALVLISLILVIAFKSVK